MRRKLIRSALLTTVFVSTAVLDAGCTTMADLKAAKGTGIVSICNEPYDLAWAGLLDTLTSIRNARAYSDTDLGPYFKPIVVDPAKGEIVGRGAHVGGIPEAYVAMYVTPLGENKTKVEIVSKQAVVVTLSQHWDQVFTDSIKSGCSHHQAITHLPWAMTL
jgi:hypothetical protein